MSVSFTGALVCDTKVVLTRLLDDGLDLGGQGLVDEVGDVEAADAVDEAEVEDVDLEGAEVEVAEDAEAAELRQQSDLLELEDVVEAEGVADEELLEAADVEVVEGGQLREGLQVEAVDGQQVLQVLVGEGEVVERAEVDRAALLGDGAGGGSGSDSSEDAGEDGRGLHFEIGVERVLRN